MNFENDKRVILTLDAGGTNFVFTAMQGGREIVEPFSLPSRADNLEACLGQLVTGFGRVREQVPVLPSAISFAFPGPADYENGIIGDLPNFPSFRGGIPLGPFLKRKFGIPVFINNDGSLFAYGEAMAGALPEVNRRLAEAGSPKRYRNLLGITFGTGFGAGVVTGGELLLGDNGVGGDIWCFRNKKYRDCIAEEGVSIRAVKRVYRELSGDRTDLTPKEIADICNGKRPGDQAAARQAFAELGEVAGDAIAMADTIVDGLVVIGGGVAHSSDLIFPSLVAEMNSKLKMFSGDEVGHMQMRVYNLEDPAQFADFVKGGAVKINIPGTDEQVDYDPVKRVGVVRTRMGASAAISMGAYVYALNHLG
ncbi:ROK family protein [Prevotella sp. kh1p2]|uniref:ROK family protein n=1 Tax=Prevotella sp. kh1p2 TaxID=1761883 RepID=UPI0008CBCFE0|nr:ROK family protein [Prevotella sp. kh1p2]SES75682.1 glucokinase [Prevotella sp. kh1p2]SNU10509.1 glucokinase [Prevotellaceae bacterium KH2P17]